MLRSDSAGYNHWLMDYCDQNNIGFVIGGRQSEAIFQIIQGIQRWQKLQDSQPNEQVGEGLHFVGPEKEGAVYRLVVVRKRNEQRALFPEFEFTYRLYVTDTDWSPHQVVRFYRKRGDAENVIRELKEGYAAADQTVGLPVLNIAGVVARHARRTVLRLSVHYRYRETFHRIYQLLQVAPVELRL